MPAARSPNIAWYAGELYHADAVSWSAKRMIAPLEKSGSPVGTASGPPPMISPPKALSTEAAAAE